MISQGQNGRGVHYFLELYRLSRRVSGEVSKRVTIRIHVRPVYLYCIRLRHNAECSSSRHGERLGFARSSPTTGEQPNPRAHRY